VDDDEMPIAVLPSFGKLPKLITLSIRGVDVLTRQVITNIQQARCLNTLKLSLHGISYNDGVMALELSTLECLSLSGDDLPQCTHFIRQITTRQLSLVTIEYTQPASPIVVTVASKCRSLQFLHPTCDPSQRQ
jgi:Leucine-rich repeat (LRR) protein